MGAKKRGSYRKYNKKKHTCKRNLKENQYKRAEIMEKSFASKLYLGSVMFRKVHDEEKKHFIGERITLKNRSFLNKDKDVDGLVVGIYPHFLLLDCGNYKTTISYVDLNKKGDDLE